jgi:alpha-L-fucosidase
MVFMGPETWVPGSETGHVVYPMWNAVNTVDGTNYSRPVATTVDTSIQNDYGLLETDAFTGHPLGEFWRVRECTTNKGFDHGGWFWHRELKDIPIEYRMDLYYRTVGLGANTIINLPPDKKGLIDQDTVKAAKVFGDEIKRCFSTPVAQTNGIQSGNIVELTWDKPCHIDHVVTMENIANGQKVSKYILEAFVDGKWQNLKSRNKQLAAHYKPEIYNPDPGFETIGHKKIDRINSVYTNRIRFRCLDAVTEPVEIRKLAVYNVFERTLDLKVEKTAYLGQLPFTNVHFDNRSYSFPGFDPRCQEILGGKQYDHSIKLYPYRKNGPGSVTFFLDILPVQHKTFKATIGLPDSVAVGRGSVDFGVELMHENQWKEVYRSKVFNGGDLPEDIEVDLNGAQAIRLLTGDAADGINTDHATWGNPRLTDF